ncbi:MAG: hypothetical protein QME42_00670 [bacterium]|nr:hypothetical protein [bacterium]
MAVLSIEQNQSIKNLISTNNVLVYLQFWLNARVPCALFPWGPPEHTYGATYGSIAEIGDQRPNYTLPPIDNKAKENIKKLLEDPITISRMKNPVLLLGATSGLQLSKEHKIKFNPEDENGLIDEQKNKVKEEIMRCFGPHVGSYHNKVFKRFLYATQIPLMIFITGDKIDCEIVVGKCHFILDNEFSWDQFYENHPLAFCVGCKQEEKNKYIDMFRHLNFEIYEGDNYAVVTAFIARNKKFIEEFEITKQTAEKGERV